MNPSPLFILDGTLSYAPRDESMYFRDFRDASGTVDPFIGRAQRRNENFDRRVTLWQTADTTNAGAG